MALTRACAHELGPHGITVNCICPGLRARRDGPPRLRARPCRPVVGAVAAGPPRRPQDIARAALFLASSDSDYLTGDALNVSGGMALH